MTAELTDPIGGGAPTPSVTGLLHLVRVCAWCRASIEHRRPQARYCGESCRVMFTRAKRGKLTTAERGKCADCAILGRHCSRHVTKTTGNDRKNSAWPHPLWDPPTMVGQFSPRPNAVGHKWEVHAAPDKFVSFLIVADSDDMSPQALRVANHQRLQRKAAVTPTHQDDHPNDRVR